MSPIRIFYNAKSTLGFLVVISFIAVLAGLTILPQIFSISLAVFAITFAIWLIYNIPGLRRSLGL